jgi:hypothetical protein
MHMPTPEPEAAPPAWRERLHERRISDETIDDFGISSDGKGWTYPVPGAGGSPRWKNFDSSGQPKYRWVPTKPKNARYYHCGLDALKAAIAAADGQLWLVGGEPDVWALHSAGLPNALCWLNGEKSVPNSLADDLLDLGVREVHYPPDRDKTGRDAARKLLDRLDGSSISLTVHELPEALGAKGDVGKYWQTYDEPHPFDQALLDLPELDIPPTPADASNGKSLRAAPQSPAPSGNGWVPPARFIEAIEAALGVKRYKSDGWSNLFCCPFHDDKNPSANWHREMHILHCFACDRDDPNYGAIETGEKLGINWQDYVEPDPRPSSSRHKGLKPQKNGANGHTTISQPQCLPLVLRLALLSDGQVEAARVWDALLLNGWDAGRVFTVSEAIEACSAFGISARAVREGLKAQIHSGNRTGSKAAQADQPIYLPLFGPIAESKRAEKREKNKRGRPPCCYQLPATDVLCALFNVSMKNLSFPELPGSALASSRAYRIAAYHALIEKYPGAVTREELGKLLGVSPDTVCNYDRQAGIYVEERYQRTPLTSNDLSKYTDNASDMRRFGWLEDAHGRRYQQTRDGFYKAKLNSGGEPFYQVYQLANRYSVRRGWRAVEPTETRSQSKPGGAVSSNDGYPF